MTPVLLPYCCCALHPQRWCHRVPSCSLETQSGWQAHTSAHHSTHVRPQQQQADPSGGVAAATYSSCSCSAAETGVSPVPRWQMSDTADVRHSNLVDRVPPQPQPGGHERKGTKQDCICSGTKDICPWPEQLFGMISQGQRLRLTDTRLVLHKTSHKVLGCPNVC